MMSLGSYQGCRWIARGLCMVSGRRWFSGPKLRVYVLVAGLGSKLGRRWFTPTGLLLRVGASGYSCFSLTWWILLLHPTLTDVLI